jgi:hypothetical protein
LDNYDSDWSEIGDLLDMIDPDLHEK